MRALLSVILVAATLFFSVSVHSAAKECIPVYSTWLSSSDQSDLSLNESFNSVITSMIPLFVYLDITLSDEQVNDIARGPDDLNRIYFFVKDAYAGSEYLIHLKKGATEFGFSRRRKKLEGYFEIFNMNGPRQGVMSVNLRPFKPTLKKCR